MGNLWRLARTGITVLRKPEVVRTRPLHFQLEPATGCNLACLTCRVPEFSDWKTMPLDRFKHVFDQVRPLKVGLSGSGEPFLNKDMTAIIRHAKDGGAAVLTTTNFTMCRKLLEELVDSGLDLLKISLDAAEAATFKHVRGKDFFDRILADLRELQEIKRRRRSRTPYVRLQFVIQHDNFAEMVPFADLAAELGADSVYFQPLDTVLVPPEHGDIVEGVTQEKLAEQLAEIVRRTRAAGLGTNAGVLLRSLPAYYRKYEGVPDAPPDRVCLLPWFSVYVNVDGDVRPCCSFRENETLVMGNVFEEPFESIWNNERFRAFRRASRECRLTYEVCRNCTPNRVRDFLSMSAVLPGFFWRGARHE